MGTPLADGCTGFALAEQASFSVLRGRLEELDRVECRVVVISGATFAAEDAPRPGERLRWLELFELPTVFAWDGELQGAAFDIALACDIRVCGAGASLRASSIGTPRLMRLISQARSVELLQRGLRLSATEAQEFGLVSAVGAEGESADGVAAGVAEAIAARGPIATRLAKEAIWRGLELPMEQALRFETDLTLLLQTTKDRAEGVAAFVEKRRPEFTGE
jgi:methylglutaconyl-CoA hydratase